MLEQLKIGNILFLDIETVPGSASYQELPDSVRLLWDKKSSYFRKNEETSEEAYANAGIYAEFGKIICISTGMIGLKDDMQIMRLKSFYGVNEIEILKTFADLISRMVIKREIILCAHNGKEFDFPYIARRMIINGIKLPAILDTAGRRPWEIPHIDTMELWKFGDHKHYTSLNLLASVFGLESPKSDIDGSQVSGVFYGDMDMSRIVEYCRRDVITVAQILLKFKGEPTLDNSQIVVLDNL